MIGLPSEHISAHAGTCSLRSALASQLIASFALDTAQISQSQPCMLVTHCACISSPHSSSVVESLNHATLCGYVSLSSVPCHPLLINANHPPILRDMKEKVCCDIMDVLHYICLPRVTHKCSQVTSTLSWMCYITSSNLNVHR